MGRPQLDVTTYFELGTESWSVYRRRRKPFTDKSAHSEAITSRAAALHMFTKGGGGEVIIYLFVMKRYGYKREGEGRGKQLHPPQ